MTTCPFCTEPLSIVTRTTTRPFLSVCTTCMNPLVLRYEGGAWQAAIPRDIQDVRHVAQKGSVGDAILEVVPQAIANLPILPEIAHRIMAMIRDSEVAIQDLIAIIQEDQVIALKILKLANSPVYGGLTEIKDLRSACARLGMRVIANTVQAIANGRLYKARTPAYAGMMMRLWRHALATAQCANDLAVLLAEPNADVLFVAGLIHDVGKVLLLDIVTSRDTPALRTLRDSPPLLGEVLAGYHSLLGLHIVRRWNLPPEFGVTTFCHDRITAVPDDTWLSAVHTVALASVIAAASGFGVSDEEVSLLSHPSTKFFGLTDIKLATLRMELEDKIVPLIDVVTAS